MNRYSKWMAPFALVLICSTAVFAQSNRLNNRLENRAGHLEGGTEQGGAGESTRRDGRRMERLGAREDNQTQAKVDARVTPESDSRLSPPSNLVNRKIDRVNEPPKTPPARR